MSTELAYINSLSAEELEILHRLGFTESDGVHVGPLKYLLALAKRVEHLEAGQRFEKPGLML